MINPFTWSAMMFGTFTRSDLAWATAAAAYAQVAQYVGDLLSGLAYYTARAGNRDAALDYVKQLLELDPENPTYAQMAKQIEGAR